MATELLSNSNREPCSYGWIHTDRASSAPISYPSLPDPTTRRAAALDLSLISPETLFARGLQFKENQEHEKALDAFNAAVQLRWQFTDAHIEIGNSASILKDYGRALAAYASAIEIHPHCAIAYYNTALTYLDMSQPDQALTWLRETIKVDRLYRLAYLQMAQLFASKRRDRSAICLLIKAAYLEPRLADPLIAAGNLYYRNTDEERAIRCFERAVRLDSWNANAYYFLGLAYYRKGDFARAVRSLSFAANCDSSHKQAAALLRTANAQLRPKKRKSSAVQESLFSPIELTAA